MNSLLIKEINAIYYINKSITYNGKNMIYNNNDNNK